MDIEKVFDELKKLVSSIGREDVKRLVMDILENPQLSFSKAKPLIELTEAPAAPRKHHLFPGGLLVHTLAVTRLALAIADTLKSVYGIDVDRDLVIAAAVLHDIYKVFQYERDTVDGGYRPRADWYLSHDYALIAELATRKSDEKLIRVCSEVHGVAPITTVEGLVVHLADSIDARLGEYLQNLVLIRAKDVEAVHGCKQVQLAIETMKKLGLQETLRLAIENPAKLREVMESLCVEAKKSG